MQALGANGVARVPCALEQERFFPPLSTKTTKFIVKNRCKSVEEARAKYLLQLLCSLLFQGNKTHLALKTTYTEL